MKGFYIMLNQQIFTFLQNTLADSRGLMLSFINSPEQEDLSPIDIGIRAQMQQANLLYDRMRPLLRNLKFGEITVVRDPLLLTGISFKADTDSDAIYHIGPFRSLPYEEDDYARIHIKNGLTLLKSEELKYILKDVPCNILCTEVMAIAKNILFLMHNFTDPVIREINLEELNSHSMPIVLLEDINERAKIAENFYAHEEKLLKYICEGNEEKAFYEAKFFTRSNIDQRIPNRLLSHRSLVNSANTLYRKAAQSVGIHPIYLDEISQGFAKKLALCTTHQQIDVIYHDMIVDYCALCRTHSTQQYSPNMRTIINYISLNLSEDINLNSIAEAVNFSPSYISRKFKEEVSTTIPKYIAQQRIELAKSLLEKTGMSVKEISYYIGIPDWNYFTKLFKKTVGMTPSEYKKNI
jgi:YesN/AraC family two-component response regulator